MIELLLRAAVRYAASRPELAVTAAPGAPPRSPGARGWRAAVSSALYGLAILVGIFIFPKLAAIGYLPSPSAA